jgi:hypothetical protein
MFNNSYRIKRQKVARRALGLACAILAVALFAGSCSKGYSRFMKLPADPAIASELGWAVVTSAYARAKTSPGKTSAEGELLRRGTIFPCSERRIDPEGEDVGGLWYRMAGQATAAWLHESDLSIFTSEEQAREAAAALP